MGRLITEEKFRSDLYYRLAELTVTVPPLRERLRDLGDLVRAITRAFGSSQALTPTAFTRLQQHTWPGNVRELQNALRRAIALSDGAPELDAPVFDSLHAVAPGPQQATQAAPFEFPEAVRHLAGQAWAEGALPPVPGTSQYEQRALHRATCCCSSSNTPS